MIDLKNYNDKKTEGLISIQKIDDKNMAIATRVFSAEDGSELSNQVVGVTILEVDEAIATKKTELAELEAFKKDLLASK